MKAALIFSFLSCFSIAYGQWQPWITVGKDIDYIAIDNLNNVYAVGGAEMWKYDIQGNFQFRYSNKELGSIGSIDVTYPLRPLLLYPDLNYLTILDNTLSDNRGRINLLNYGIGLGVAACASVENHFWIYDAMEFSLVRLNENFKTVTRTGNLAQVLRIEFKPNKMVEFANRLYVNNPTTGIIVFDIFGTYIKTIPLLDLKSFQVFKDEIVYYTDSTLVRYNTMSYQTAETTLPEGISAAYVQKERIVGLKKNEIVILKGAD